LGGSGSGRLRTSAQNKEKERWRPEACREYANRQLSTYEGFSCKQIAQHEEGAPRKPTEGQKPSLPMAERQAHEVGNDQPDEGDGATQGDARAYSQATAEQ
jgi:hypothetical protein